MIRRLKNAKLLIKYSEKRYSSPEVVFRVVRTDVTPIKSGTKFNIQIGLYLRIKKAMMHMKEKVKALVPLCNSKSL